MAAPGFAFDFLMIPLGNYSDTFVHEARRVVCTPSSTFSSSGEVVVHGRAVSSRVFPAAGPFGERLNVVYHYKYTMVLDRSIEWVTFDDDNHRMMVNLEESLKDLRGKFRGTC